MDNLDVRCFEFQTALETYIDAADIPSYVKVLVLERLLSKENTNLVNSIKTSLNNQNGGKHNIMEGDANGITE